MVKKTQPRKVKSSATRKNKYAGVNRIYLWSHQLVCYVYFPIKWIISYLWYGLCKYPLLGWGVILLLLLSSFLIINSIYLQPKSIPPALFFKLVQHDMDSAFSSIKLYFSNLSFK